MTEDMGKSCLTLLEGSSALIRANPVNSIDVAWIGMDQEMSVKDLESYSYRAPAAQVKSCFRGGGFL